MKILPDRLAGLWCTAALLLCSFCTVHASTPSQGFDVQPWPLHKAAPALVGVDMHGRTWRLADLRGKAVLVNFWASWCEPCRAEMPSLQALAQRLGPEKLVVLAVNFKEPLGKVAQFVQNTDLQLPVLPDTEGRMARAWGISIFPSTVLIGSDGRVRAVVRGELNWESSEAALLWTPLLSKPR